jgi:acid phosphatase type 7
MGGISHYSFTTPIGNTEAYNTTTYGVLKLTLHAESYDFDFVPEAGKTYSDKAAGVPCH